MVSLGTWSDRWTLAEAQWVMFGAVTVDLVRTAEEALVASLDTPSLRLLAGSTRREADVREQRDLLLSCAGELGRTLPGNLEAAQRIIAFWSRAVQKRQTSPLAAARQVAALAGLRSSDDSTSRTVGWFASLEDEWTGGYHRAPQEIELEIREAATTAANEFEHTLTWWV